MATAGELVLAEELGDLQEIAMSRQWDFEDGFNLGMPARDGSRFWLRVDCADYPAQPAAWHWYNPQTGALDRRADTPTGGGFLHPSGRICAPWNRLAYKQCDPDGPHGDWELASWAANPRTGKCTTLAAMALRLFVELNSKHYQGRLG
jgi:hypothetical protein